MSHEEEGAEDVVTGKSPGRLVQICPGLGACRRVVKLKTSFFRWIYAWQPGGPNDPTRCGFSMRLFVVRRNGSDELEP
jgi:hypothetical protein